MSSQWPVPGRQRARAARKPRDPTPSTLDALWRAYKASQGPTLAKHVKNHLLNGGEARIWIQFT